MKLSWFNTQVLSDKQYQACTRYEQYKAMQDIREIEFIDS